MDKIKRIFTSLPFIIGVFLIIYACLGSAYIRKQDQYQGLQSQIALKSALLQKPRADLKALEDELNNVEMQLKEKEASLPNSEQGIEIIDTLLEVAQMSNVEVVSVQATPPSEKQSKVSTKDNVTGLATVSLTLTVQGTQNGILAFISNLTGSPELLKSSEVKGVTIGYNERSGSLYTTQLELRIYVPPKVSP